MFNKQQRKEGCSKTPDRWRRFAIRDCGPLGCNRCRYK